MPSWFPSVKAVASAAAGLAAFVAAIVDVLATVGVFRDDQPVPVIDRIGDNAAGGDNLPPVIPGEILVVTGSNLDLVTEVVLRRNEPFQEEVVGHDSDAKSQLTVRVPIDLDPGNYSLVFHTAAVKDAAASPFQLVDELTPDAEPPTVTVEPATPATVQVTGVVPEAPDGDVYDWEFANGHVVIDPGGKHWEKFQNGSGLTGT